jgi:hypothetical protein
MCFRISNMSLCKFEIEKVYTLEEFKQIQFDQLKIIEMRLKEFRNLVKEVVISACRGRIYEAGFYIDFYNNSSVSHLDGNLANI